MTKPIKINLDIQKTKALYAYAVLLVLVSAYHAFSLFFLRYLIPVYLISIPIFLQKQINIRFSVKDIVLGMMVSFIILIPFYIFLSFTGKTFSLLPINTMFFQLLGISFPEEVFFRGFLQEKLGNTIKGLFIVSILFSLMHLPQFIFYGNIYSLLTFFPSLVMGYLYMRTSNILPSTIFHFLSNIVFLGF